MANYSLVTTSTFQPFTYDELAAPILAREKEHKASELAAMTLQEQIADLQGVDLGSDERNTMLNDFRRTLDEVYNQLGESGITPDLSRRLHGLKRDYARDILPIIKKVDALNLAEETRSKLTSENPNIMFKHSLPTIGQAIDGAKIDQGYWDTSKVTLSIEEQVAPLISDLLSQESTLKSKESYADKLTAIKDKIRNSNAGFMPEGFNSDSIINNTFNDLYYNEYLRRAQEEDIKYARDNRGKNPYPGGRGKSGNNSNRVITDNEVLNPYKANGELKEGWKMEYNVPVPIDTKVLSDILTYIKSNVEERERRRTPYFPLLGGAQIENTIDFTFEGDNQVPKPKDQNAYKEAWRAIYKPNMVRALKVDKQGNLEFIADDMISGKPVAVKFAGTEVTNINSMHKKIQEFIANHPEAGVLRRNDGSYVVHYYE